MRCLTNGKNNLKTKKEVTFTEKEVSFTDYDGKEHVYQISFSDDYLKKLATDSPLEQEGLSLKLDEEFLKMWKKVEK